MGRKQRSGGDGGVQMTSTRDRIDKWLGEMLARQSQGESLVIVLVHAAVDQTQRTVKTWRFGEALANVDALITDIDEVAEQDAEGLGGRQRYLLRAQTKGRELGSLTMRYEYRPDEGSPAVDSEPATAAGTIAVLQRHAEAAMRMMVQSFSGVIESYKEQVNAQKTLIGDFQRQAAENFRIQEQLASRKLEQEVFLRERETHLQLTAAREQHEIEKSKLLWNEGVSSVKQWLPVLLHYLTKGEAGASPEAAMDDKQRQAEEELFAHATDADIQRWKAELSPADFELVMARLKAYRGAKGQQPAASPGGEDDDKAEQRHVTRLGPLLYAALVAARAALEPLAMSLAASRGYDGLSAGEKELVDRLVDRLEEPGVLDGRGLWTALADTGIAKLVPLVTRLRSGARWDELDGDAKKVIFGVVARAMRTTARTRGGDDAGA